MKHRNQTCPQSHLHAAATRDSLHPWGSLRSLPNHGGSRRERQARRYADGRLRGVHGADQLPC
jgi:hypothetical protein